METTKHTSTVTGNWQREKERMQLSPTSQVPGAGARRCGRDWLVCTPSPHREGNGRPPGLSLCCSYNCVFYHLSSSLTLPQAYAPRNATSGHSGHCAGGLSCGPSGGISQLNTVFLLTQAASPTRALALPKGTVLNRRPFYKEKPRTVISAALTVTEMDFPPRWACAHTFSPRGHLVLVTTGVSVYRG